MDGGLPQHAQNLFKPFFLASDELSLAGMAGSLLVAATLSFVLRWYYLRFSRVLANRRQLADILPLIALTTLLVITIVKSSLALSLGLVGALSIVRFRTPVKEPEELAYLFLAIGIGLGTGAGQPWPVAVVVVFALVVMYFLQHRRVAPPVSYNFLIDAPVKAKGDKLAESLMAALKTKAKNARLVRLESGPEHLSLAVELEAETAEHLAGLTEAVKKVSPKAVCTFMTVETP